MTHKFWALLQAAPAALVGALLLFAVPAVAGDNDYPPATPIYVPTEEPAPKADKFDDAYDLLAIILREMVEQGGFGHLKDDVRCD